MGGHLDDGEPDQEHPIFSYSFGLSCIFLIGGMSKDDQPLAVVLESGDLCIMSGFSRKCFHGVPKVLPGTFKMEEHMLSLAPNGQDVIAEGDSEVMNQEIEFKNSWEETLKYMETSRVNMNFRQVLLDPNDENFKPLSS
jgi:alkylated DNA repair protein alkB family protein 1